MTSDRDSIARPKRRHPIHQPVLDSGNRSVIVFVTICTKNRAPVLATQVMHQSILHAWRTAEHWLVGRYVVMPDHIHLFCSPGLMPPPPLTNWVRHWKAAVCKAAKAEAGTIWQTDYWDTQLRRHERYTVKWEYVRNNPVRAGLVTRPNQWPYQGELNVLRWHD